MKFTAIILLSACLTASASGNTQGITIKVKETPLEKVFQEIKKQSGYSFVYAKDLLQKAKLVTVDLSNISLDQALQEIFKDQPFSYTIISTVITINTKENKVIPNEVTTRINIDIRGRILNENGEPVIASILIKGTQQGTTSNTDGYFELKGVDENAILQITATNIEAYEIKVNGKNDLAVKVKMRISPLDEVVVKPYGTDTKRLTTSNIGHVSAAEIDRQPVQNPLLALQGRIPGITITQLSGVSGGAISVRIQGKNSISNGNEPLIVIDGIPYPTKLLRTRIDGVVANTFLPDNPGPSPLSFINPKDIESIDVLKDADATAIYGSRAANGAILITTKKGKAGKTKIDINLQRGWARVNNMVKMLNTREYLDMRYEALRNDNLLITASSNNDLRLWDTTRYTNWQNELIGGTAKYTNINASVSGGTSTLQYIVGATYNKMSTVFPGDFSDQNGTLHFSLNAASANNKLRLQFSGSYSYDENRLPNIDLTNTAILLEPDAPKVFNNDGSLNWAVNSAGSSTWANPYAYILNNKFSKKTGNLLSNLQLGYNLLKGLDIKLSTGYNNMNGDEYSARPLGYLPPEFVNLSPPLRSASFGSTSFISWITEPQLTYNKKIGLARLELLIGGTIQNQTNKAQAFSGSRYASDQQLNSLILAPLVTVTADFLSEFKYNAGFARINYNLKDKYIINLNIRRDGSSRFGDKSRFHNFGSIGGAWIFNEEQFIKKNLEFLSFGKLRGSYGSTGSDGIGDYSYLDLYGPNGSTIPYQGIIGLGPSILYNPYLEWEETRKLQIGVDIGILKDRILFSSTYARNRTSNQLLAYQLPLITGFTGISKNFPAIVENTSWEFSVSSVNIKRKNLSWKTGFNITFAKNRLIAFSGLPNSTYSNSLIIGQPLGIQKAYHFLGIDPASGIYLVADSHGNPVSVATKQDATVLVNTNPKYYGGIQNSIEFIGLQLDFLFQFTKQIGGRPIYFNNGTAVYPGRFVSGSGNQPISVLNRWQKPGDITTIQRFSTNLAGNIAYSSDAAYEDASYVRLKNLSLSWSLPEAFLRKYKLQNIQLYLQGQNLWTITKYDGLDPESQSLFSLPPLKMWTVGLKLGL